MKITELAKSYIGIMTLKEDQFVTEMGNFLSDVTDLPANIVLWTKPQPEALPHDKYRMKIFKDRVHAVLHTVSGKTLNYYGKMVERNILSTVMNPPRL